MINHRFSNQAYDDLQDKTDPTKPPPSIHIAQSEVFDIIQTHRYQLLKYVSILRMPMKLWKLWYGLQQGPEHDSKIMKMLFED